MPSLRKRTWPSGKTSWDIRYWRDGVRRYFKIGETDRRTAEKIFHQFSNKIAAGEYPDLSDFKKEPVVRKEMTIGQLAETTRVFAETNKSPSTRQREEFAFKALVKHLGNTSVSALKPGKLEEYKAKRLKEVSAHTINIEIRVLNTALAQAIRLGWCADAPKPSFKQIRIPDGKPPDWLTEAEIDMVLGTPDVDFKNFLTFLMHTGCRRNEALGITWADVDLGRDQIVIRGEIGKMGKRRTIPINSTLNELLQSFVGRRRGKLFGQFSPNQVSMKFRRWAKDLSLRPGISIHSLRSTFACQLIKEGVDIYTVTKLLGHSSVRVTEKHYVTLDSAGAKSAVEKINHISRNKTKRKK